MPLDDKRQAILDTYCYLFEGLISELDIFDEIPDQAASCYTIVTDCFDLGISQFGNNPPDSRDRNVLLEDLLERILGLFVAKYSSKSELTEICRSFKDNVLEAPNFLSSKIDELHETGRRLSDSCYSIFCDSEYAGSKRMSNFSLSPGNRTEVSCIPKKHDGTSEVHLNFCVSDFNLMTYLNLPFYFFHEYLSHIHSAVFLNESFIEQNTLLFEDGWLIYVAYLKYKDYIQVDANTVMKLHKMHYLDKYRYSLLYSENGNKYARKGYQLAENLASIAGADICDKISFLLATNNYDSLAGYSHLHINFLSATKKWLSKCSKMKDEERKNEIDLLSLAIEDREPLKSLLDIMS